ncbi:MAG: FxsA family protein [Gammaproteobacteria bacterium]|nr:FxsA family protein [Gammaproteobacteria bacterium]
MRILPSLFLLIILVPLVEIYLLIQVGGLIGALPTVIAVVLTAVIGSVLIRQQGLSTLQRARQGMSAGQLPAMEMLEGIALLVSGAFLLTPGFFTDAVGFLLLVPLIRRGLIAYIMRNAVVMHAQRTAHGESPSGPTTYEGEAWKDDDQRLR